MLKLYYHPFASFCHKALIAIAADGSMGMLFLPVHSACQRRLASKRDIKRYYGCRHCLDPSLRWG